MKEGIACYPNVQLKPQVHHQYHCYCYHKHSNKAKVQENYHYLYIICSMTTSGRRIKDKQDDHQDQSKYHRGPPTGIASGGAQVELERATISMQHVYIEITLYMAREKVNNVNIDSQDIHKTMTIKISNTILV